MALAFPGRSLSAGQDPVACVWSPAVTSPLCTSVTAGHSGAGSVMKGDFEIIYT